MSRNEISQDGLNREYREGRWKFLSSIREMSRHGIIASWLMATDNTNAVLDVGCGEGHFYKRIEPLGLKRYVGIDLAEEPLNVAKSVINPAIAQVECADLTSFVPQKQEFSAIVFNEVLNYTEDATEQILKYANYLIPSGVVAISIYAPVRKDSGAHKRIEEVWSLISGPNWELLEDTTLTSHLKDLTWRMALARPSNLT